MFAKREQDTEWTGLSTTAGSATEKATTAARKAALLQNRIVLCANPLKAPPASACPQDGSQAEHHNRGPATEKGAARNKRVGSSRTDTGTRPHTRAHIGASWHCGDCVPQCSVEGRRSGRYTLTGPFRDSVLHNNGQQPDTQASAHIELPFPSLPCLPSHRAIDSRKTRNPTHNSLCAHCHGLALHSSTRLTSAGVDKQKPAGAFTPTAAFTSNSHIQQPGYTLGG